jgi:hypothetical protein
MAYKVFTPGLHQVNSMTFDWVNNTFKLCLLNSSYTFDIESASMTPLAAGRLGTDITVGATKTVVLDGTNHFTFWKTTNTMIWTGGNQPASGTIIAVALYKFTTNDAGSVPLCYYDVTDLVANNGDITFTSASDANGGMFKLASA